jgi:uncharacterized protein DUF3562
MNALTRPGGAMLVQHQHAIESLAERSEAPPEVIESMYWSELSRLEPEARVTQFLPIFTSRRVRERLRRQSLD